MNILIIEDDQNFAHHLQGAFERQDVVNRVSIIHTPHIFYKRFHTLGQYDVMLVDLTLSGDSVGEPSGFGLIKSIREAYSNMPIIVISGQEKVDIIERAFMLGASDYISKNIRLSEIRVRVIHWFRRYCLKSLHIGNGMYAYKSLLYNTETNIFQHDGKIMTLSRANKYILGLFLMHAETILSETYLTEKIWGDYEEVPVERNLRVAIARLRKVLEEYGMSEWIESIYGEGYVFRWRE